MSARCTVPPAGWRCTRPAGHGGPCAAIEETPALHPEQIADLAARCGVKGSAAALAEFVALVREAEPMAPDEMRPAPVAVPVEEDPVGDARPELTVWCGAMPESNGKSNFTAMLVRKDAKGLDRFDGFTIARSEYPDRVRYEADCVRHLIGELAEKPWITDYDANKHSGYKTPQLAPQPGATNVLKIPLTLRPAAPGNPATCEVLDAADRVLATGFTPLEGSEAILRVNIHAEMVSALRQARDVLLGHDELRAVERVEGILAKAGAM